LADHLRDRDGFGRLQDTANKLFHLIVQRSGDGVNFSDEEITTFRVLLGSHVSDAVDRAKLDEEEN